MLLLVALEAEDAAEYRRFANIVCCAKLRARFAMTPERGAGRSFVFLCEFGEEMNGRGGELFSMSLFLFSVVERFS